MRLPPPSTVGGYNKMQCFVCTNTTWKKIGADNDDICGACKNGGEDGTVCQICFEPRAGRPFEGKSMNWRCLAKEYCWPCTATWVATQIDEGVCDVVCPGPDCRHQLGEAVVRLMATRGYLKTPHVQRLKELRNHGRREYLKYVLSGEDAELTEWAVENTQACPHCFVLVQRTDGCAHITCTCKGEFWCV